MHLNRFYRSMEWHQRSVQNVFVPRGACWSKYTCTFFVQHCCHLLLSAVRLKLFSHILLQKFCCLLLTYSTMIRYKLVLIKIPVSIG